MINKDFTINDFWATVIIEELVRNNVRVFFISPGSRSTPLTIAAARHPDAKTYICYDERGAGYAALGYAKAVKHPAVLICTSGTATANYFPAIIEAKMDNIPMIILTADRPPELHDNGSNQTIDQTFIYNKYIKWATNFPCPTDNIDPSFILTTIDQAVYQTNSIPGGPVHINNMYREPLIPLGKNISNEYKNKIKVWAKNRKPYTSYYESLKIINAKYISEIVKMINNCKKGLILIGRIKNEEDAAAIKRLSVDINLPVWADILSCLKFGENFNNHISHFNLFSKIIIDNKNFYPDLILHFGGSFVSKTYLEFIKKCNPDHYIVINNFPNRYDPEHKVTIKIESSITCFCNELIKKKIKKFDKGYMKDLYDFNNISLKNVVEIFKFSSTITEPQILFELSKLLPDKSGLFLGNSMPIRNMDDYFFNNNNYVKITANRGVSGIEGNISTACGYAIGLQKKVVMIIGDISFIHDLNSLYFIKRIKQPIIIILINNNSGGIFSKLPITQIKDVYKEYFLTPHSFSFKKCALQFNIPYINITDIKKLKVTLENVLKRNNSILLEITVDINNNDKIQKIINKRLCECLDN